MSYSENGSPVATPPDRDAPVAKVEPAAPTASGQGVAAGLGETAKLALKGIGIAIGLAVVVVPAALCWIEARLSRRDDLFAFCGQTLALVPGRLGSYLRRCFYYLTLRSCSLSCDIGFLSSFNDRRAEVGRRVYIGAGTSIGLASLGDGCLIGSRAGILSGGDQHRFGPGGRLTPFDPAAARRVRVGEETWIGEAAILMADVGSHCIVAAGSVVSIAVPDGCVVGGNPARFVRRTTPDHQGTGTRED